MAENLHRLKYIASNNQEIDLDNIDITFQTGLGLKIDKWNSDIKNGLVNKINREAHEIDVDVIFTDIEKAKEALHLFNNDNYQELYGYFYCDDWYQAGNVVECKLDNQYKTYIKASLKIILRWGYWLKPKTLRIEGSEETKDGLDFPFDFEFDFQLNSATNAYVDVEGSTGAYVGFVFYGAVDNPAVIISGNKYQVNASCEARERIIVDPYGRDIIGGSIYKVNAFGGETNLFDSRLKGARDSGSYIFQKLPPGHHKVNYSAGMIFDVIFYEESGTPPWI